MTLKYNSTESNIRLHFQGNTIDHHLLGVTIDEQLNFNAHINEIIILMIIIIIIMGNLIY